MRGYLEKRRTWLGRLMVVEAVACYMAVLTLVSHARGPEKYRVAEESPLLTVEDFTSFTGESAGDNLWFENDTAGAAVGYSAELSLEALGGIHIAFQVECPAEFAGGTLYVDLYNLEAGYDDAGQEYMLGLESGANHVEFTLDPGKEHPENAQLRFFTLDEAGYGTEGLAVSPVETMPKISAGMMVAAVSCFIVLAGTAVVWHVSGKITEDEGGEKRGRISGFIE